MSFGKMTLEELEEYREKWKSWNSKDFDANLVVEIYKNELNVATSSQRVRVLEISQYLENYLWPRFDAETASLEHVMSIVLMVNEKFRENVPAWACFHEREEVFQAFFKRVLSLKEEKEQRAMTIREKTNYLLFMIHCFQSLEDEKVRVPVLRLVGLSLWHSLSPGRLRMEFVQHPQLLDHWRKLLKQEVRAEKKAREEKRPVVSVMEKLEVRFLPSLLEEFLGIVQDSVQSQAKADHDMEVDEEATLTVSPDSQLYCERFAEFLIDLLSQLPTRRFVRALVEDRAIVVKSRLSALYAHRRGDLFRQLVDLLEFYQTYEINDQTGTQFKPEDVELNHSSRVHAFQLHMFKAVQKLQPLAVANVGFVDKRSQLIKSIAALSSDELKHLVCRNLQLVSAEDPWTDRVDFLKEVLVTSFERRQSQRESINALPLYPNETVMWDENLIPSIIYTGAGPLALPKLNLQFLTLHDYLLRNFNLFRLESTYEIREDIQDVLKRMGARYGDDGETVFSGWSRMATPVKGFKITEVKAAKIGENKPAAVIAAVSFTTKGLRGDNRSEWDALKEHDVLFLLTIRVPSTMMSKEESAKLSIPEQFGLQFVRGCEVIELHDEDGTLMNDFTGRIKREDWKPPAGEARTVVVGLDNVQYQLDMNAAANGDMDQNIYETFNLLMRRKPKENNFKAILESIRDLMNEDLIVPTWLHDILLGYGDPASAQWKKMPDPLEIVDFKDTFLDAQHLRESFPSFDTHFVTPEGDEASAPKPPFQVIFPKAKKPETKVKGGKRKGADAYADGAADQPKQLVVKSYVPPDPGPYPQDQPKQNTVRFTPVQVDAVLSGVQPGLTTIVGPPGTGKTDTAVQILHLLYHNFPMQRTLIITHSNQALNDIFEKIMQRDVPARYLLRLGQGEQELDTDQSMSRQGRVNAMLKRRLDLLTEVERLAKTLKVPEDAAYTCETAAYFWLLHVLSRWEEFMAACEESHDAGVVKEKFPFQEYFNDTPRPLFSGTSYVQDMEAATGCFRHLKTMFQELEECRGFELLKSTADRANYLMAKQAKIVAMTCTHAALKRRDFLDLNFKYDNLLMEESAQILEIETFIPMLLQRHTDGRARLKRCILIGDHHQLPPVVKNVALNKYSHLDQSLFTRFVRLGVPYIQLNAQGRARPSIAKLYNWRYKELGDLPNVQQDPAYNLANTGFGYEYQLINVEDYEGVGESEPSPHFYQNLGEAEYVVSVFMYMRLLGYPAEKISILTTYNGQKSLIRDVIAKKCSNNPLFGRPSKVTTVDKFQGQQNDYILLSLVRSKVVGHLRDVRRLVVAMSRARLGLYVFCRRSLFENCYELLPTFRLLLQRPVDLSLVLDEPSYPTQRPVHQLGGAYPVRRLEEMVHIVQDVYQRKVASMMGHY